MHRPTDERILSDRKRKEKLDQSEVVYRLYRSCADSWSTMPMGCLYFVDFITPLAFIMMFVVCLTTLATCQLSSGR